MGRSDTIENGGKIQWEISIWIVVPDDIDYKNDTEYKNNSNQLVRAGLSRAASNPVSCCDHRIVM